MKTLFKSIAAVAVLAFAATSCQKETLQPAQGLSTLNGTAQLATECCGCVSDSVIVTGTHSTTIPFYNPASWNPIYFSLCNGVVTDPLQADFKLDNRFTSYITGQNGITAGVLSATSYSPANFNSITCFNTADWNTATSTLGAIGVPTGADGWYNYNNNDPLTVLPSKLIVLQKVCNNTTYYYLVKLRVDVDDSNAPQYESKVTIQYKCITSGCGS